MKLLVDMNLSPDWDRYLAEAGFDAFHWSDVGAAYATDADLMSWAATRSFVVVTCDLDFSAVLAAQKSSRPSVLQISSALPTPAAAGPAVLSAISHSRLALISGAIISIDASRSRLRILHLD